MDAQLIPPPDGNQNRNGPIIGMTIGALAVSTTFVSLRMYTRIFLAKSASWDDWTIVLAWVRLHCHGHDPEALKLLKIRY